MVRARMLVLWAVWVALSGCQSDHERLAEASATGKATDKLWCSECHRVSPDQPSGARAGHTLPPPVIAPSFMAVANRPGIDADQLREFVSTLHLPMPTFRLSPAEQEDVITYILTLREQPPS